MMGLTRRAFTLIELLVVIAIIAVLLTLSIAVGSRVIGSGKGRQTEQTIKVLDTLLSEYLRANEDRVPKMYTFQDGANFYDYPLIDARRLDTAPTAPADIFDEKADPAEQSLARFLAVAKGNDVTDASLKGIDAKLIRETFLDPNATAPNVRKLRSLEVLDGWGKPIRFVHPAFQRGFGPYLNTKTAALVTTGRAQDMQMMIRVNGTTPNTTARYRRSYRPFDPAMTAGVVPNPVGDADEGICAGNRPYFYSSGADKDPGTRKDNIYSTVPTLPEETKKFE
ncbi:MAG: type II secretion system protein [Phycisphaerales bacterium]